ncbi:hypothetical protein [Hymenobacter glacieicola]|uniref:Uncharacterized protein n=1 Tax=Hymenobacter glacieicola TaxID=1562124 RepID=A0ABQ1X5H2_9BACT|nr:hypothetical protein [Hymenobacter glacieicola]GGG60949.1 hypothetical protein GCM10011378_41190 [Hymenobacter glacieicola]
MAYRTPANQEDQVEKNKLRAITEKDVTDQEQWLIDRRFVLECQRLEREGRVENRVTLEEHLGMFKGALAAIRRGVLGTRPFHISRLKQRYNGDVNYILFALRQEEISAPIRYMAGVGKVDLRKFEPFTHEYSQTAKWKAGPLAEEDAGHFPDDPQNLKHPHLIGKHKRDEKGSEESEDDDTPVYKLQVA